MWTRAELKQRGKFAFKKNYWVAVLVSLVLMIATGGGSGVASTYNNASQSAGGFGNGYSYGGHYGVGVTVLAVVAAMAGIVALVGIALTICVWHPLEVGGRRYFMENREGESKFGAMGYAFKSGHYGNVVLTMFLRNLFTALWFLLLIVPGIIKTYEYRMIPYILAENPEMNYKDVFSISKNMMKGQKMDAFILDLSFIGWAFLTILTCGIVGIFYVNPYINATNAELYAVLRDYAFHVGGVTSNELPGFGDGRRPTGPVSGTDGVTPGTMPGAGFVPRETQTTSDDFSVPTSTPRMEIVEEEVIHNVPNTENKED